jgi:PPOX class probable F420-dependent enzyme
MEGIPEDVRKLVDGPNFAHVATVLPDGAPHSVPVWIGFEDNRIVFLTSPNSRKARNLERDPRLAISITDRNQPHRMAQIRGRMVERVEGDRAWAIIDRLSQKYIGQPYPLRTDRVVYMVEPERASGMSFG